MRFLKKYIKNEHIMIQFALVQVSKDALSLENAENKPTRKTSDKEK